MLEKKVEGMLKPDVEKKLRQLGVSTLRPSWTRPHMRCGEVTTHRNRTRGIAGPR
jgi:hypothetical protein